MFDVATLTQLTWRDYAHLLGVSLIALLGGLSLAGGILLLFKPEDPVDRRPPSWYK